MTIKKKAPDDSEAFKTHLKAQTLRWSRCDKIDDILSNFETFNSNDALRSKHHAVWETISRKEKLPITRKLSNASNGTDAVLVEVKRRRENTQ